MKRSVFFVVAALLFAGSISSCSRCKTCHAEVGFGGVSASSPSQELCGEELKKAEATPGMVCE